MNPNKSVKNKVMKIIYNSPLERNINLVLRYYPIVKKLKEISRKDKMQLKVLEIGSGSIGITRFYNGEVVGIDVEHERYKNPRLSFINGSATKLPFSDSSFDVVISVDTLEHLTRKDQVKMVLEAYRVAKKHILFTYPVGFNKYQKKIIASWKKSHLTKSLEEHLHGGTAKGDEITRALKNRKYQLSIEYGTHPAVAYYLNYLEQNMATKILSRTFLKILLPLLKKSRGDARKYFFVTKLD